MLVPFKGSVLQSVLGGVWVPGGNMAKLVVVPLVGLIEGNGEPLY